MLGAIGRNSYKTCSRCARAHSSSRTNASASSTTETKRRLGLREQARSNQESNALGSEGWICDGTGMGAAHTFSTTSPIASPSKGTRPHAAENAQAPKDQISEATLTGALAVRASGLM